MNDGKTGIKKMQSYTFWVHNIEIRLEKLRKIIRRPCQDDR
jgi:hypothetical protein